MKLRPLPFLKMRLCLTWLTPLAMVLFMVLTSRAESVISNDFSDTWIQSLNQLNTKSSEKNCFCTSTETTNTHGQCPKSLKDLTTDDPKDSLFGLIKSYENICSKYLQQSESFPAESLLSTYTLSAPQLQDHSTQLNLKNCIQHFPKNKANKMISKYFNYQNRLEKASLSYLGEIAAIDSILNTQKKGITPKLGELCTQSSFKSVLKSCDQYLNRCAAKTDLTIIVQQTHKELNDINQLKIAIKDFERQQKTSQPQERALLENKIAVLKLHIKNKEQLYPWLSGQRFQREIKANKNIQTALLAQLQENRSEIVKDFHQFQNVSRCLRGNDGPDCLPEKIRSVMAKTPTLAEAKDLKQLSSSQNLLALENHKNYQQCMLEGKVDQDQTAKVISGATRDAGIAFMTLGFGSIAMATKSPMAIKNLAQLGLATSQSHLAVSEIEKAYDACSQKVRGLNQAGQIAHDQVQCPQIEKNILSAIEYDSCFGQASMAILTTMPLGLMKYQNIREGQAKQTVENWNPQNKKELEQYFYVHNREVNKNATHVYVQNNQFFTHTAPQNLKLLRKHDLEKFLSFKTLATKYQYKGIPKEIILGLKDNDKYLSLISKDGKNVEMSISQALYVLWGHSGESLAVKIKTAKTAAEKTHWQSMLKLRNYVVNTMASIDDQIMGSIYKSVSSAQARVELKFIELISDLAARKANPITKTEMDRPILGTYDYLSKMGRTGIIRKISDANSADEVAAATSLINKIGMPNIQKMSVDLETSYRSSGLPTKLKYSMMSLLFTTREKL